MKYPRLKAKETRQFSIEAMPYGCNACDGDRLLADTDLVSAENVWWQNGALRTRTGFRVVRNPTIAPVSSAINWKFAGEDTEKNGKIGRRFLRRIQSADGDVSLKIGVLTYNGTLVLEGGMDGLTKDTDALMLEYPYSADEDVLIYLNNGSVYAQNSKSGDWRNVSSEAYVPCVLNEGKPIATGWKEGYNPAPNYEGRNLLTDRICAKYTTDGVGYLFCLPYTGITSSQSMELHYRDASGVVKVYTIPAGESYSERDANGVRAAVNRTRGTVFLADASNDHVILPVTGKNNVTVYASKLRSSTQKQLIGSMNIATWYGGSRAGGDSRQFVSGSSKEPNRIYWAAQGQPLYFPFDGYMAVGDVKQKVTAFGKQDGNLFIFKKKELFCLSGPEGTVSEHWVDGKLSVAVTEHTEYFSLRQLHSGIGCVSANTVQLYQNQLCWADAEGKVYTAIKTSDGFVIRHLSAKIEPLYTIVAEGEWENAQSCVYKGYYLLQAGRRIFALKFNSQTLSGNTEGSAQKQPIWYMWDIPFYATIKRMIGNDKYLVGISIMDDSVKIYEEIFVARDDGKDVFMHGESLTETTVEGNIVTKSYDFGEPLTNKRVLRIYVGVETASDAVGWFSYYTDGYAAKDISSVPNPNGIWVLTPAGVRVNRFGVGIRFDGVFAMNSIIITYR